MLHRMLQDRHLPPLRSREEMLQILLEEVYGRMPPQPDTLHFQLEADIAEDFMAGKATLNRITATGLLKGRPFRFPFYAVLPTEGKKYPFFVSINWSDLVPDQYMPAEELLDNGFAILCFHYRDITTDDNDFTNGLAGTLYEKGVRGEGDCGKLAIWAWAAQRVLDYAYTLGDLLDLDRAVVCGHSRLGKTALLAGATDPRFRFVYANDSGCAGAAISRQTRGETVKDIYNRFPFWFCGKYKAYIDNENAMPFDQHYLLAAIAPRYVLVGSAEKDIWADPIAEQLSCLAASAAFETGISFENRLAGVGEAFLDGHIGYHLRKGAHSFSRADWHKLIQFVKLHSDP